MSDKKPAVKSLGMWGSLTSIVSWVYLIAEKFSEVPTDLLTDTASTWAMVLGTVSAVAALFGRWRAVLPISGIFKSK